MRDAYDVIIVGAGPAGSMTAMLLAQQGLSVLLLERDVFPRYHIGESLTGTAGDFIFRHGFVDEFKALDFPSKPGVKVIGRDARHEFWVPVPRPTFQVRRAEFDDLLLRRAIEAGAEHARAEAKQVLREGERVVGVAVGSPQSSTHAVDAVPSRSGDEHEVRCRLLVDASGQGVFLSRQQIAGPRRVAAFNRQIALYTQFEGVEGDVGEHQYCTVLFYRDTYHWSWMIPISSTAVSIGVVLPTSSYKLRGGSAKAALDWGLAHLNPELTRRTANARQIEEMRASSNYSYRITPFVGPGWMCVGDSHRFTDPIFSFGVSIALTEAHRAAQAILAVFANPASEEQELADYANYCNTGQQRASDLIRYFWKFPAFFSYMTRGEYADDMIQLLAGDLFSVEPLPATIEMRKALTESPVLEQVPEGRGRDIARRIYEQFDFFQGVDAAFLDVSDGVKIYFILTEDDIDLYDSLYDFEEQLVEDFGRDDLAVFSYTPDLLDAMPALDGAFRIFDRRRERSIVR